MRGKGGMSGLALTIGLAAVPWSPAAAYHDPIYPPFFLPLFAAATVVDTAATIATAPLAVLAAPTYYEAPPPYSPPIPAMLPPPYYPPSPPYYIPPMGYYNYGCPR